MPQRLIAPGHQSVVQNLYFRSLIRGPFSPFIRVHVIALAEQVEREKEAQEEQDCQPVPRANWPLKSEMQNVGEPRLIQSN